MQGPGFRLPGLQGCGKEAPGRAGCLWELCERPTEHKCVCTMPQNLEVQNAPTTSQSHSTGLEAEEQEGSLLWPHTSPHGLIPPVPWPGDNLPLPCPALSFAPLAPHTRAKGTASSSHQWPLCLLPLSLGSRGRFPRFLLCWKVSSDRPVLAESRSSLSWAVAVPLLPCQLCCHL